MVASADRAGEVRTADTESSVRGESVSMVPATSTIPSGPSRVRENACRSPRQPRSVTSMAVTVGSSLVGGV